jgi:hypothetical protein
MIVGVSFSGFGLCDEAEEALLDATFPAWKKSAPVSIDGEVVG